ncbi:50S ribosomal protein L19 [Labeo rohita]|uniref:50S ribosomal protein L19 n=1 Tax=Labeo rohita TaxID=84645 RepID=A0ABQ8M2Z2_LABRO|nr:50S ribosomal protein L19 [Labeo rohita]
MWLRRWKLLLSLTYKKLLEVMAHATKILDLPWRLIASWMSDFSPAISLQLICAFHFFQVSTLRLRVGLAGGALHIMAVRQAYQAELLKDLDQGQGLSPEVMARLSGSLINSGDGGRRVALVASGWKVSGEVKEWSAAFERYIPQRSKSKPPSKLSERPGPSWSENWRQSQKVSVATHAPSPPRSLHTEVKRSWRKPYSAYIYFFSHANYASVEAMHEHGYMMMPPIEKMLTRCLSVVAVRQAYQADLLKDLDQGQGLSPKVVARLSVSLMNSGDGGCREASVDSGWKVQGEVKDQSAAFEGYILQQSKSKPRLNSLRGLANSGLRTGDRAGSKLHVRCDAKREKDLREVIQGNQAEHSRTAQEK